MTTQIKDATGATVTRMTFDDVVGTGAAPNANVLTTQGNVASGVADTGNPVKVGGVAGNSPPTAVTAGQRVNDWRTVNGATVVAAVSAAALTDGIANNGSSFTRYDGGTPVPLGTFGYIFNGTTWDRERKPNIAKRVVSSAAAGSPDFLKATAGDLSQFWGVNTVASLRYLQIYNKATAPVLGTDTPVLTYPIPASSVFNQTMPNGGMYFSAGIAYAITTDAAGATGAAAADITSFAIMGA